MSRTSSGSVRRATEGKHGKGYSERQTIPGMYVHSIHESHPMGVRNQEGENFNRQSKQVELLVISATRTGDTRSTQCYTAGASALTTHDVYPSLH